MPTPKPSSQPSRRQAAISLPASSRIAIAISTARPAGSGQGTGSLKNTMILAEEVEHFLGLGRLREGGVTAQVAEDDDDLTAMTFEDFLVGKLGREKPFQPPDAAQLLNLLRDPRLKPTV